jgi:hypothetical protein
MNEIVELKVLEGYRIWLKFADGIEGIVDLSDLAGQGVFEIWNDHEVFERAAIGPMGCLQWGEEVDICPDSLYLRITHKRPEDIFPSLRKESVHA